MNLCMLTDSSLDQAAFALSELRAGREEACAALLRDSSRCVDLGVRFARPSREELPSRFKLGLWLHQLLENPRLDRGTLMQPGLWTWLSLAMIDVICPIRDGGRAWLADDARYLFRRSDYRKSYRHLLAGPYFLVRYHSDNVPALRAVLANPPESPGELFEQLSSRKPIFLSTSAMEVAARLFWNPDSNALRRGATTSGAGGARRLADVLMQLDVTHDLVACDAAYLWRLMPREFAKWQ